MRPGIGELRSAAEHASTSGEPQANRSNKEKRA